MAHTSKKRLSREERKAQTRVELLQAARSVFARRGFYRASVEEIAEQAGFSTGAVYSNFAGKEDLFLALFDEHVNQRVAEMAQTIAEGDSPAEQARRGADQWMAFLHRERDWFLLFIEFWAYAMRDPRLRRRFATRFAAFPQAIASFVQYGAAQAGIDLPETTATLLGRAINALGNGLALEKLADPDAVPDELFGDVLTMILGAGWLFDAPEPRVLRLAQEPLDGSAEAAMTSSETSG